MKLTCERHGRKAAFIVAVLVCLASVSVFAKDSVSGESESNAKYKESPRRFIVELKFAPYRPAIDSEFSGTTPFKDVFGGGQFLMSQLEFEYELWNKVGIIALGATVGYSRITGLGINPTTMEKATDATALNVMPFTIQLVYRFDYLAHKYNVPIVPHVKGGLDYYVWWIENGIGDVANKPTASGANQYGRGGTFGGHVAVGAAFLLDFMAPKMAQTFDVDVGVNNSYIFFEYVWSWINDFGAEPSMNLSSGMFVAGLAFEF